MLFSLAMGRALAIALDGEARFTLAGKLEILPPTIFRLAGEGLKIRLLDAPLDAPLELDEP